MAVTHFARTLSALSIVASAGLCVPAARAQAQPPQDVWTGEMGITESVAQIMARAPRDRPRGIRMADERGEPNRDGLPSDPDAPAVASWPPPPPGAERPSKLSAIPPTYPRLTAIIPGVADNPQTIGTNVGSITISEGGYVPPDTQAAVGLTQIVACSNGWIKSHSKATGAADGALNTSMDSFFQNVRNGSAAVDNQVRFDRLTNRWIVLAINTVSSSNRVCIAVSSGPTITGTASFTFFFFQQDTVAPAGNTGQFADYPSLGIDANALYIGANMFGPFTGSSAWVVRKSSITGAGPIAATAFRNIATTVGGSGPYSPRGVDNDDPASTEGYFIGPAAGMTGRLVVRRVSNPGGVPTISSNLNVTVPSTATPPNAPAQGSAIPLDTLDDRLFAATLHRDRTSNVRTLITAHNIRVNSAGVGGGGGDRVGSRWYQLGNLTGPPALVQAGTFFDSAATNPNFYTIPSAAMSGQGHIAVGATRAGATVTAGVATAGRLATDPLGTIQSPTVIVNGGGTYNAQGAPEAEQRWGDYSATMVDPVDDQTLWTFQEYCNANNSWALRLTRLIAPPPATPVSASPAITQGDTGAVVTVTGSSVNGSQFYDTASDYPNRMQVSIGGSGVTVNSATWNSPTQVTLSLTVAANAPVGARAVTVTNPDGQAAASASGILTINAAECVTFTQQPQGGAYCPGAPFVLTVAANGTTLPTYQWKLDSVEIAGATGTTYQVNSMSSADVGIYTCTATNPCGSLTSAGAVITLTDPVAITQHPQGQTVPVGSPASFTVSAVNAASYQWFHDSVGIAGATNAAYTIPSVSATDAGVYACTIVGSCGEVTSQGATLIVGTPPPACYANCDQSTTAPVLNVADFTCFLQSFANGNAYANCDASTTAPVLNVADFTCFLQKFASGCP